jgi:hypothetical protein
MSPANITIAIFIDADALRVALARSHPDRNPDYDSIVAECCRDACQRLDVDEVDILSKCVYVVTKKRALGFLRRLQDDGFEVKHHIKRAPDDRFSWHVDMALDVTEWVAEVDAVYIVGGGWHLVPVQRHCLNGEPVFVGVGFPGTVSGSWENQAALDPTRHSYRVG